MLPQDIAKAYAEATHFRAGRKALSKCGLEDFHSNIARKTNETIRLQIVSAFYNRCDTRKRVFRNLGREHCAMCDAEEAVPSAQLVHYPDSVTEFRHNPSRILREFLRKHPRKGG